MPAITLASQSPFRAQLLQKLNLNFTQQAPKIDETPQANETPQQMVMRLTHAKALALSEKQPHNIIIASDQTACLDNTPLGKPHTYDNAVQQLESFSGKVVTFYTGLGVIDSNQQYYQALDITKVHFRKLNRDVIAHYLKIEQPLNCAGSFKSEGLGICLFEKIESKDPNALIGLPLIELTSIFYQLGYPLPRNPEES